MTMWWKMAVGAALGFAVGHYVAPGYPLWMALGVAAGFGTDVWLRHRKGARSGG